MNTDSSCTVETLVYGFNLISIITYVPKERKDDISGGGGACPDLKHLWVQYDFNKFN